jgi:hypothetical protein
MTLRARLEERDLLELCLPICRRHGVTVEDLDCQAPAWGEGAALHEIWAALHETGNWSFPRIGKLFGRHHVTVLQGVRSWKAKMWQGQRDEGWAA